MTLNDLQTLIEKTRWFEHLGEPLTNGRFVRIPSLAPWANLQTNDDELAKIADQMEWLPSSRDQDDPFYGTSLEERSYQHGKKEEYSRRSLDIYKKTLTSLRSFNEHPVLKIGPYDFTEAACGAALYASRCAAYEILVSDCGIWCAIMNCYEQGHWPCGILPNGNVVVL